MNLLSFHRLMITLAIVFSAGFALRETTLAVQGGGAVPAVFAVASAAVAVGLFRYLRWWLADKAPALRHQ